MTFDTTTSPYVENSGKEIARTQLNAIKNLKELKDICGANTYSPSKKKL